MANLTDIADQKTPARPSEITFAPETGLPSANQELLLVGHAAATGMAGSGTAVPYQVIQVNNVADPVAAKVEAETKFGVGSELAKMVVAAVQANAAVGGGTFPTIRCMPLLSTDADYGSGDIALAKMRNTKAEFIATCYDGMNAGLRLKLRDHCAFVGGPQRVENNQFGTIGVVVNQAEADPSNLDAFDSYQLCGIYLRDSAPALSLGEIAAACAARMAANAIPFNPMDNLVIGKVAAPVKLDDWISVGAGAESETALQKGWTPLRVLPTGDVAFVRTVVGRITTGDGSTAVTSYYDVQDFQVLYFWRKTIKTRESQPDFANVKASIDTAKNLKAELIRLMHAFQDANMFQAVDQLAKLVQVQRSATDRYRFDVLTPVNVIPGLHVISNNIQAGVLFDNFSV